MEKVYSWDIDPDKLLVFKDDDDFKNFALSKEVEIIKSKRNPDVLSFRRVFTDAYHNAIKNGYYFKIESTESHIRKHKCLSSSVETVEHICEDYEDLY
ncbi:MAG: hypothetical protein KBT27_00415 [Prevotellaceae bacterium]|nr:hypothetical protein [Candidatus Faecinaster equi]